MQTNPLIDMPKTKVVSPKHVIQKLVEHLIICPNPKTKARDIMKHIAT